MPSRVLLAEFGGSCVGTGGRLLTALSQVRFLPPELFRFGDRLKVGYLTLDQAMEVRVLLPEFAIRSDDLRYRLATDPGVATVGRCVSL